MNKLDARDLQDEKFAFGRDELGPIVADYLERLLQTCRFFDSERDAAILFAARAGVCIRHALSVYVGRLGDELPKSWQVYWVSRMMIAKGVSADAPEVAAGVIDREMRHLPLETARACLTGKRRASRTNSGNLRFVEESNGIGRLIARDDPSVADVTKHLREQSALFRAETDRVLGDRKCALFVDTGWAATSQRLLLAGRKDVDWWGCYFGLWSDNTESRAHWSKAIPLMFQADDVDWQRPETSVIAHRHLIEDLFEPDAPSIESYRRDDAGNIVAIGAKESLEFLDRTPTNPLFAGVLRYLETAPPEPGMVARDAAKAWQVLAERLLTPSRSDATLLGGQRRCADFGREFELPVLVDPDRNSTPDQRISSALWRAGQIALEFEPGMAIGVQRNLFGLPPGGVTRSCSPFAVTTETPKVAVITRTMDRTMFLRRSLLSVHAQTFKDYRQIVVCDGGDCELVRSEIELTNVDHSKIDLIDNVQNRGMEAASNIAIRGSESEFIVIHDDDDTWQPDFLQEMVAFLDSKRGQKFGGVICEAIHVSETVHADGLEVHALKRYREFHTAPTLDEMRVANSFPPIAFLFRREIYDRLGGFNESLPVLGDWDFNIRFLEIADIGLHKKTLANYHFRDVENVALFGNSVVAGQDKHAEYNPIVLNMHRRNQRAQDQ